MSAISRLFFALWPDEAVRAQVAEAAHSVLGPCGGKVVPARSYHITLVFLGHVPAERVDCLCRIADGVRADAFSLVLDRFGHFPQAHVAWLGLSRVPSALEALCKQVAEGLPRCQMAAESRPYHPHLTLVRKATCGPEVAMTTPIHWHVNEFVLVESEQTTEGSSYRVLRRWPLSTSTPEKG